MTQQRAAARQILAGVGMINDSVARQQAVDDVRAPVQCLANRRETFELNGITDRAFNQGTVNTSGLQRGYAFEPGNEFRHLRMRYPEPAHTGIDLDPHPRSLSNLRGPSLGGASSVGTEMLLDSVLRTEDNGNMVVATRGLHVFQLKRFQRDVEGKLYSGGQVATMRNDPSFDPKIQNALAQRFNRMPYLKESRRVIAAPYPENLSFFIGHDLGLTRAQELQLLTMAAERDRQTYLLRHLLRAQ